MEAEMAHKVIAEVIQHTTGVTNQAANDAASAVIEAIVKTLKREGKVTLVGFGTFSVGRRAARKGRNPATGEAIKIKASKSVRFKASPVLKKAV
jgi:DNA-binding protein HU-beta